MAAYNRQIEQQQQPQHQNPFGFEMFFNLGKNQPKMPDAAEFYTGGDNWEQHTELAPELQDQLEEEWAIQAGLRDPQNAARGRVQQMMWEGVDPSTLPGRGQVYDPTRHTNNAEALVLQRTNP